MTSPVRQILADVKQALVTAAIVDPETNAALDDDTIKLDYLPRFTPEDLKDLRIVVAPRQNSSQKISRATRSLEIGIQIAVMQTAAADSERFQQLLDLAHDIDTALSEADLSSGTWSRSDVMLYDVDALERHGAFRSVITAYLKHRS
jgi:hypothetical protein